jgi:hypothetical protein
VSQPASRSAASSLYGRRTENSEKGERLCIPMLQTGLAVLSLGQNIFQSVRL